MQNILLKLHVYRIVILAIFSTGLLIPAWAEANITHYVTPRTIDLTVQPGDIFARDIQIVNKRYHRVNVYPSVHGLIVPVSGNPEDSKVTGRSESPFGDWVTMTQAVQQIDTNATTTVTANFTLPIDLESGTYYGLLGFGRGISRAEAEAQVYAGSAPAVVLRLTVPDVDLDANSAVSFDVSNVVFDDEQQAISYTIHNPSSQTITPSGEIRFFSARGVELNAIPVNSEGRTLAPGELLTVRNAAAAIGSVGSYRTEMHVDFNSSQLASLALADSFFYLPWWVLALIIGLFLVTGLWLYYSLRRSVRPVTTTEVASLPLHVYQGVSSDEDHDINLKK